MSIVFATKMPIVIPTILYDDNNRAITFSKDGILDERSKPNAIKFFLVTDDVEIIALIKRKTDNALRRLNHYQFIQAIGMLLLACDLGESQSVLRQRDQLRAQNEDVSHVLFIDLGPHRDLLLGLLPLKYPLSYF